MPAMRRRRLPHKRRTFESRAPRQSIEEVAAPQTAKFVAMVIRNQMEDFHTENLTNMQMRQLNPLIRNAVYTALYALEHIDDAPAIRAFVQGQVQMIPGYWEAPELTQEILEFIHVYPTLRGNMPGRAKQSPPMNPRLTSE